MKYLIAGRTATGKDTLARILEEDYGLRQVISATTRPRRSPDEATHRFVTPAEADAETDKVAQTRIGEYLYYATRTDVEAADIYIIDPPGMIQLAQAMPEESFALIVMTARPDRSKSAFIARARQGCPDLSEADAEEMYDKREAEESERFAALEEACINRCRLSGLPQNVSDPILVANYMEDIETLRIAARKIVR